MSLGARTMSIRLFGTKGDYLLAGRGRTMTERENGDSETEATRCGHNQDGSLARIVPHFLQHVAPNIPLKLG